MKSSDLLFPADPGRYDSLRGLAVPRAAAAGRHIFLLYIREKAVPAAPALPGYGYGCCPGILTPVKTLTSKLYIKAVLESRKTYPQVFH